MILFNDIEPFETEQEYKTRIAKEGTFWDDGTED